MSSSKPETSAATTDVSEFLTDLDGGVFDRKLSVALSQVAAAVVDNGRVGEVNIKLSFARIEGTSQVACTHVLKFNKPTMDGKSGEEEKRVTVFHVGKFGRITLAPENQMSFIDKKTGEITN